MTDPTNPTIEQLLRDLGQKIAKGGSGADRIMVRITRSFLNTIGDELKDYESSHRSVSVFRIARSLLNTIDDGLEEQLREQGAKEQLLLALEEVEKLRGIVRDQARIIKEQAEALDDNKQALQRVVSMISGIGLNGSAKPKGKYRHRGEA
ncbi:MAG: hypothetical protein IPK80_21270 [Nannocystis sp.]|nr:hypothetical protein [Nannocystis sp.]